MAAEDVPAGVEDLLLALVGNQWPGADVAGLRAAAFTCRDLAGQVQSMTAQAQDAAACVDRGITGAARNAFDAYAGSVVGGYLAGLPSVCTGLADTLDAMAATVETLRNYIIEALVVLAAQIAADVIAAPFSGGASLAEARVATAATRVLIMNLIRQATTKIIAHFASAELGQVGLTFLAQLIEICKHRQSGFNCGELTTAAVNAAIGGAVGLGMGQFGGMLKAGASKLADTDGGRELAASAGPAGSRAMPALAKAAFDIGWGSASGTAEASGQDAAAGSFGDEIAGAANGAFSGGKDRFHATVNPAGKFSISPARYIERGFGHLLDGGSLQHRDPTPPPAPSPSLGIELEDWQAWSENLLSELLRTAD
jgi:hypothetical protein